MEKNIKREIYRKINDKIYEDKYRPSDKLYNEDKDKYRDLEIKLLKKFKKDLFDIFPSISEEKKNKIFDFCWEEGHSSGFGQVFIYWWELMEIFED